MKLSYSCNLYEFKCSVEIIVGELSGIVCTSSNAEGIQLGIERAGKNGKVLFFPDQHLGRNTGLAMGIPIEKMVMDPRRTKR